MKEAAGWVRRKVWLFLLLLLLVPILRGEALLQGTLEAGVRQAIADVHFDFWGWEAGALWSKFTYWVLQPQRYMREPDRCAFVRDYAALVDSAQAVERQMRLVYADPQVADPLAATAHMRAELAGLRTQMAARQPVAEAIVEEQVEVILAEEGLRFWARPFPPVSLRLTPPPTLLIISPRERIETIHQEELERGLSVTQREAIEEGVDAAFGVSSLVTNVGGMSAWPAMVLEWPAVDWIVEVAAHEWTHHYLYLHPLGWAYDKGQEARTINETTASVVGKEVGRQVLARYYPDLLPPPSDGQSMVEPSPEPPGFDFRAEMHRTRVEVDRLLAEGRVEEAERFLEERRQFFWEQGYQIRKLNQAYFAFHGSYADEPGPAGEDPIGPAVQELRRRSPSLRSFLVRVGKLTTLEELRAALAEVPSDTP
jgi:hypothetical protein